MILLPRQFWSQPQTPVEFNWGNPLARGIVVWVDAKSIWVPSSQARSVNSTRVGSNARSFVTPTGQYTFTSNPVSGTEWTTLGEVVVASGGATYQALWSFDNLNGSSSLAVGNRAYTLENFGLDFRPYANDTNSFQSFATGVPVMCGGTISVSTNQIKGYYQGRVVSTPALASTASASLDRVTLFGKRGGVDTTATNSRINWVALWNRALSEAEVAALYENPWQIFKKQPTKLFTGTAASGAQTLTPSLFTNTNSFYSPTVTAGAVTLTPALFTNSNTFYTATVAAGTVTLTPSLYTNTNTFYSATVTPGAVTLTPSLYTNDNTFYSAIVSQGGTVLQPDLYTNTNTFYSATVTAGAVTLTPSLYTNSNTFYAPTVTSTVTLTPGLYTNDQTFYSPTVTQGAAPQTLTPALYSNTNTFYTATVTPGAVTLTPDLYTNTQAFYSPTVVQATLQTLAPDLFVNTNTIFLPVVDDGTRVVSIADVGAEDERRKKRQKKRDKEFALLKQEQARLRQEIERVIDPVVEQSQPVIVSPTDREVRVLSVSGTQVAITVPESFDAAEIAREIAQSFEQSRIKATIVERAAQTQQALAQAQEEYRRKMRRRRDDELLLLMD